MPLRRHFPLFAILLACLSLFAGTARAYVTSATLEFMADDKAALYLNGQLLLSSDDCPFIWMWYTCLSTSDGTLPLKLFRNNEDNVLGVENQDVFGGDADIAYRLTIHQSSGDPVVIWGIPGQTRFLNVIPGQDWPHDWMMPKFDDSAWPFAVEMIGDSSGGNQLTRLADAHFNGSLGKIGYVPLLSPYADGHTIARARNLYRSHFTFPNALAPVRLSTNPRTLNAGQQVAIRVHSGQDAADLDDYSVYVNLPPGLVPSRISQNGTFNPETRRVMWDFRSVDSDQHFVTLSAASIDAPQWKTPRLALGPHRPELELRINPPPPETLTEGAAFWPEEPGWLKLQDSGSVDGPGNPVVLGVMFRVQLFTPGTDSINHFGINRVWLNYSVDGSEKPALKNEIQINHNTNDAAFTEGYYDASEDRHWTWADINNLKVEIVSHQVSSRELDRVASVEAIVRSFSEKNTSPFFYAKLDRSDCATLKLEAGEAVAHAYGEDFLSLPINQGVCATPTPAPTATPAPPPPPGATPTPILTPTVAIAALTSIGLNCIQSAPEPFDVGGVFIDFCLTSEAYVTVQVYDRTNTLRRTMAPVLFRAADKNEIFFDGLDDSGQPLPPGAYTYHLIGAASGARREDHAANFTKVNKRPAQ